MSKTSAPENVFVAHHVANQNIDAGGEIDLNGCVQASVLAFSLYLEAEEFVQPELRHLYRGWFGELNALVMREQARRLAALRTTNPKGETK